MPSFVINDKCDGCKGKDKTACMYICPNDLMVLDKEKMKALANAGGIEVEGKIRNIKAYLITIANGKFAGGGMQISPYSNMEDGLLDVIIFHNMTKLKLFFKVLASSILNSDKNDLIVPSACSSIILKISAVEYAALYESKILKKKSLQI